MTDLRAIEVSVERDENDPGHTRITLSAGAWRDAFHDDSIPTEDYWQAMVDVAGIIARVVLHAAAWVELEARAHNCRRYQLSGTPPFAYELPLFDGGCGVDVSEATLRPGQDLGSTPEAYITVPTRAIDSGWLDLVQLWLEAIAQDMNDLASLEAAEPQDHDASTLTTTTHDENPSQLESTTVAPDERLRLVRPAEEAS